MEEILVSTDHGKRAFEKGDQIVLTQNDRMLGVKNGMLGTVVSVTETDTKKETSVTIRLDGESAKPIIIDPKQYSALDHGYATTIHKSQGTNVNRTFVLGSRTMD